MNSEVLRIETVEMHTGGQSVRIVKSGLPNIEGATVIEKFVFMRNNMNSVKKIIIDEPRGHANVIGVVFVDADEEEADIGLVFINASGYIAMCGDAILSVSRYVVDSGIIGRTPTSPLTHVTFQCPCGLVRVSVEYSDGKTGAASFDCVPAYMYKQDLRTSLDGLGQVSVDICYSGIFYAFLSASSLKLDLNNCSMLQMETVVAELLESLRQTYTITEFKTPALNELTAVVLTDDDAGKHAYLSTHSVFYGGRMIARAPCGSGSAAQMARLYTRGDVKANDVRQFQSPSGAIYQAKLLREVEVGPRTGVVVKISGRGYYTGTSTLVHEEKDDVGKGFLMG